MLCKESFIGVNSYLMKDVDVVVFCGEGGVTITQSVHHGAAGDDDGGKEGADTVLKSWKLSIERTVK